MKNTQKVVLEFLLLAALVFGIFFSQTLGNEETVTRTSNRELHTILSSGVNAKTREFKEIGKQDVSRINSSGAQAKTREFKTIDEQGVARINASETANKIIY